MNSGSITMATVSPDKRHERGCVRRYGAIPDPWIPHEDCECHKRAYGQTHQNSGAD